MMNSKILFQLADRITNALRARTKNKNDLFQNQILPMFEEVKLHNATFLDASRELRADLTTLENLINKQPNDIDPITSQAKIISEKLHASLASGRTDRTMIANVASEFANFPFYSKPIMGWLSEEARRLVIDYFDSIASYFMYNGSNEHAMREIHGCLLSYISVLKSGNKAISSSEISNLLKEIDVAEKHLLDRWGIISRKKAVIEASFFHD